VPRVGVVNYFGSPTVRLPPQAGHVLAPANWSRRLGRSAERPFLATPRLDKIDDAKVERPFWRDHCEIASFARPQERVNGTRPCFFPAARTRET